MKTKLILFFLTLVTLTTSAAELKVTKGMTLNYRVHDGEKNYRFVVNIDELVPRVSFTWIMTTSPKCPTGKLIISLEAWRTAAAQFNYFDNGDTTLKDQTAVFVSQYVYSALKGEGKCKMTPDQAEEEFMNIGAEKYKFTLKTGELGVADFEADAMHCESNGEKKHKMWISDSRSTPIILKMDLGWTIELESIDDNYSSQLPLSYVLKSEDLIALPGKLRHDPFVNYILAKSQNDYTMTPTCSRAPSAKNHDVFEDYLTLDYSFNMNGFRMLFTNDVLIAVYFYNKTKQKDQEWAKYKGVVPYGLNLDMTRADVEKILGESNSKKQPDIANYDDKHLQIYYSSDDPKKGKIIFMTLDKGK